MRWRRLIRTWAMRLCLAAAALILFVWLASNRYACCVVSPGVESWLNRGVFTLRFREIPANIPMGSSWRPLGAINSVQLGYKVHANAWPGLPGWSDWFHKETYGTIMTDYRVPLWPLSLATALPGAALYLVNRHIRRKRGQAFCPACDYDRSGLPAEDTPCPECGFAPAPSTR
jgi:hypothetical protein